MLHGNRARAESFGADAARYDRSRPTYPPALVDHLLAGRARRVLDVGCGTGIAARLLTARGCEVLGVEVDDRMAALARRYGTTVETAGFETWDAAGRRFDLVTCAQAWHWVEPVVGTARAADVLDPGGRIALWWNAGTPPAEIHTALREVYRRTAPGTDADSVLLAGGGAARFEAAARTVRASGRFGPPSITPYPHERHYTTTEWLDQLPTHSDHALLPPDRLRALLDDVGAALDAAGGGFTMRYETWLVEAERLDDAREAAGDRR